MRDSMNDCNEQPLQADLVALKPARRILSTGLLAMLAKTGSMPHTSAATLTLATEAR